MKFYNREIELKILEDSFDEIDKTSRMVVITGRRRIGKTLLSLEFSLKKPHLYLFVAKKDERLLCQEFVKQIKELFDTPVFGEITSFKDIFRLLLEIANKKPFVLIIDEFQEFLNINPSLFSDIQKLWDLFKYKSKIQVLFLGSVYSLMHKIFQDKHEPLFGRADQIIHLKPFSIKDIHTILCDHKHPNINLLFDYYLFTGGTPKYIDMLIDKSAFSKSKIIDYILSPHSPFLIEGKNVLIEEFGKDYGIYFSILELISYGKTKRSEIESILQRNIGGYLDRMETNYHIINKYRPINAKPNSRSIKYQIRDHFLKFWFRFIYRNKTAVEIHNFEYIKKIIDYHFETYSGKILEQFFYDLFASTKQFNLLGSYWERGFQNEIDIVAINEMDKKLVIAEVKKNKEKINIEKLKLKSLNLLKSYPNFSVEYLALSLKDAKRFI